MKILWVDDQIEVASTFAGLLEACSHKVVFACDAEEALLLLSSQQFDVILADLRMPPGEWGGLWLLEKLKLIRDAPLVIVVSGEGAQQETIQALRLGAVDYITKDRLQDELEKQIKNFEVILSERRGVAGLLASGENHHIEFKSTLRYNLHSKKIDQAIELAALKSIAGFLNSAGGTLLIGVSDAGEVLGIEADQFVSIDKFQLHFWNLVREKIGTEVSNFLSTSVSLYLEKNLFRVDCKPSGRPVFICWKAVNESKAQELFFIRAGPQTEQLNTRQATTYISDHFHRVRDSD